VYFQPTFDKHCGKTCGGFQLHITDRRAFKPWAFGQLLLRELYHAPGNLVEWRQPPFEYEEILLPIDLLNGSDRLRQWVETNGDWNTLQAIENEGLKRFLAQRESILLYGG
jgi:uncharacterized protein YbbC (DUF1343 family)